MKRYLFFSFFAVIILFLMGFGSLDNKTVGAIVGFVAGLMGGGISYFLCKNEKQRNYISGIIFVIVFFFTKNYLVPYYYVLTLDADIKQKYPFYSTIATYYPAEYNEFLKEMKKDILNGDADQSSEVRLSNTLVNYAIQQSVPYASVKVIYNNIKIRYQVEKKLYSINPILVLVLESPARLATQYSISSLVASIPQNDLNEIMNANAKMIESGSKDRKPIKMLDDEIKKATETFQEMIDSLIKTYGIDAVRDTFLSTAPFKEPEKSAQIMLSFDELLLAKGQEEGGLLFKIVSQSGFNNQK